MILNNHLENLLNYANAPIIVWDAQFRITRFNHAFEFLTGRSESEVIGQSLEILFPAELAKITMAGIRKTSIGERWESVEVKILIWDDSVRTVLWNSAMLFEADGKTAVATIAQGQDITKRKQVEEALRESELRYRTQFEQASDGILHYSTNGDLLDVNESFARMHGYSVKEMQHMRLKDLDPSQTQQIAAERIRRVMAGEMLEFEVEHYHKDGHLFPLSVSTSRISIGSEIIIQAHHRDITERKELEQSLRNTNIVLQKIVEQRDTALENLNTKTFELETQNEELCSSQELVELTRARYFDLYDLAPVGYCTVGEKGLIFEANLTAALLLGVTKTAMIRHPLSIFITRQNQDIYFQHHRELLETGTPQTYELQMIKKDGSTFWARLETSDVSDISLIPTRMTRVVISDISETKRVEIKIKERLKEMTCLNAISQLVFNPDLSEQQLCEKVIDLLIPVIGYPEIAAAAINLNGIKYQSANYSNQLSNQLSADIHQSGQICGNITVYYTKTADFSPPKEQNLLDNIAKTLGLWNERKISDKKVKKFSQAIEQSPLSIMITTPEGVIEYVNTQFCAMSGYLISEIVGKNP